MENLNDAIVVVYYYFQHHHFFFLVILYLLFWSIPLVMGQPLISVFAFLPLVLVPPVGYLVYWLIWKEFHA